MLGDEYRIKEIVITIKDVDTNTDTLEAFLQRVSGFAVDYFKWNTILEVETKGFKQDCHGARDDNRPNIIKR